MFALRCQSEEPTDGSCVSLQFLDSMVQGRHFILHETTAVLSMCAENEQNWLAIMLRGSLPKDEAYVDDQGVEDGSDSDSDEDGNSEADGELMDEEPILPGIRDVQHEWGLRAYALDAFSGMVLDFLQEIEWLVSNLDPVIGNLLLRVASEIEMVPRNMDVITPQRQRDQLRQLLPILERVCARMADSVLACKKFLDSEGELEYFRFDDELRLKEILDNIDRDILAAATALDRLERLRQMCCSQAKQVPTLFARSSICLLTMTDSVQCQRAAQRRGSG